MMVVNLMFNQGEKSVKEDWKVDFSVWERQTLEQLAKELMVVNDSFRSLVDELKSDRKMLLDKVRELMVEAAQRE
jgi:hypothetical protein